MKSTTNEKLLYIDSKDFHLENDSVFAIHPSKLEWLSVLQKGSFDRVVIQNVPAINLKSLAFFGLAQILSNNGSVEVLVDQPISVMQNLDAAEIEANAKLGGFTDIKQSNFEQWIRVADKDTKYSTIKLTMIKPEKSKAHTDNSSKGKK